MMEDVRPLSEPDILQRISKEPLDFKTNILVVGGAYAGLSAAKSIVYHISNRMEDPAIKEKFQKNNLSITMIEPRAGFLNILGIPKAIVDAEFAGTQYIPLDDLNELKFDSVISNQEEVTKRFENISTDCTESGVHVNFIHGNVTSLSTTKAEYSLVEDQNKNKIEFDYVILATGRNRNWPTTPPAYTYSSYLKDMSHSKEEIQNSTIISIVGGGAVGVEIAGDIKSQFPEKTVNLIHAHSSFPPEPLSEDFKALVAKSLAGSGIKLILNTRITEELKNGDLKTHTGSIIKSDLTYWCTSPKNNVDILSQDLKDSFLSKSNNLSVNQYLQLESSNSKIPFFFCTGDIVDLPIIKSAGWAMYMGRQVANNLVSLILDKTLIEPFLDLTQMPKGMVIVGGNNEIVSELCGVVELNNESYVHEYKDYCIGKIRATIGI